MDASLGKPVSSPYADSEMVVGVNVEEALRWRTLNLVGWFSGSESLYRQLQQPPMASAGRPTPGRRAVTVSARTPRYTLRATHCALHTNICTKHYTYCGLRTARHTQTYALNTTRHTYAINTTHSPCCAKHTARYVLDATHKHMH